MAEFSVRVEIHNASREDYDKLHEALNRIGVVRTVQGGKGLLQLPTGTYWYDGPRSGEAICDAAAGVAATIKATPAPWVFVAGNDDAGDMWWWSRSLKQA